MSREYVLKTTPVEVEVLKSNPYFWHNDFIGQRLPVIKVLKTSVGLYFHVDTGQVRPSGCMEGSPWGISEIFCRITQFKEEESVINEKNSGI